ncbi:MAG: GTPase, partial [Cetobacterium sp.]|uniref:GTPase n=1 Tax=Cetobacterium sp. TaxID=2071632 RepID=UPI002FCB643F
MKNTPNSNRLHIGIFGKTNSGKSSLLNAITEQDISIVSDIAGTTTDSVTKAMEFLPYGPVLFIDTAGLEDESELGEARMKKTIQELKRTDFALLVMDVNAIDMAFYKDQEIIFKKYNIPFVLVLNNADESVAKNIAEKIRCKIDEMIFVYGDIKINITCSLGIYSS